MTKILRAKKLLSDLNKLVAQFLTGFPKPINKKDYLSRKNILRKKFQLLK